MKSARTRVGRPPAGARATRRALAVMGCDLGKLASSASSGDDRGGGGGGGKQKHKDRLEEPPSPGPPDPRLPLTAKQKYSMIASWKGISRAMEPTGVYMFIKCVPPSTSVRPN